MKQGERNMNLVKIENFLIENVQKKETINLEQLIESLVQRNKPEITTKELQELGCNKYQMKKLEQQRIIIRVKRDLYQVQKIIEQQNKQEKAKINRTNFRLFQCCVLEKNFKEAYQYLCDTINTRVNHAYDEHYYLYLKLLKEILKEEDCDFSMLENGEVYIGGTDNYEIGSIMEIYKNFKYSVLNDDFEQASKYISEFEFRQRKMKNGKALISTQLFLFLTNEICRKQKDILKKEQQASFNRFYIKLREKNFEDAYRELYNTTKKTNYYGLYFILLKEILGDDYDFSFLENGMTKMPIFIHKYVNYPLLRDFKEAILNRDFISAKEYIEKALNIEKTQNKTVQMSTEIYSYLMNELLRRQKDKMCATHETLNIKIQEDTKKQEQRIHFTRFYINLREKNFEGAYQELCKIIKDTNHYALYFILLKEILGEENYDFSFLENAKVQMPSFQNQIGCEFLDKFKEAVLNRDFVNAKVYIKKAMEIEKNQNKSIRMRTEIYNNLIEEVLRKQKDKKDEIDIIDEIPTIKIQKEQDETLESESKLKLNRINIRYLISNKKYKQAKILLEKELPVKDAKDNNYFQNILKLLNILEEMETGTIKFIEPISNSPYQNDITDSFSHFFEALERKDFKTAYSDALICEQKERVRFGAPINFENYINLLNSILIYKNIKEWTYNKQFIDFKNLRELYQEKIQFSTISKEYDMYVLDVLDLLESITDSYSIPSFCPVKTERRNIINQWEDAMNIGDYPTALQIMHNKEWKYEIEEFPYKDQIVLIYKVLTTIRNKIENDSKWRITENNLEPSPTILEHTDRLKALIQREEFEECKQFLNEIASELNEGFVKELQLGINFLSNAQKQNQNADENKEAMQYKIGSK